MPSELSAWGRAVAEECDRLGLNQKELAHELGCHPSTLYRQLRRTPSARTKQRVQDVLTAAVAAQPAAQPTGTSGHRPELRAFNLEVVVRELREKAGRAVMEGQSLPLDYCIRLLDTLEYAAHVFQIIQRVDVVITRSSLPDFRLLSVSSNVREVLGYDIDSLHAHRPPPDTIWFESLLGWPDPAALRQVLAPVYRGAFVESVFVMRTGPLRHGFDLAPYELTYFGTLPISSTEAICVWRRSMASGEMAAVYDAARQALEQLREAHDAEGGRNVD